MKVASALVKECNSKENFIIKVGFLASLFEVDLKNLRNIIMDGIKTWGLSL